MRETEKAFAVAIKIHADPNVDPVATMADNALRVAAPPEFDPSGYIHEGEMPGEQTGGKGSFAGAPPAGRILSTTIKRRMRGTGVAYALGALPKEDALLMAVLGARAVDTTAGAEKVEYNGVDDDLESVLAVLLQTYKQQFKGLQMVPRSAMIEVDAGSYPVLTVDLVGVGEAPTQQALEAATLDSVIPPIAKSSIFTIGGQSLKFINFKMDFGLRLSDPILDGTAGEAWAGHVIVDREVHGTVQLNIETLATFNPYAWRDSAEERALVLQVGSANYNKVRIEADKVQCKKVRPISRGGVGAYELEYRINRATAPSVKDPVVSFPK